MSLDVHLQDGVTRCRAVAQLRTARRALEIFGPVLRLEMTFSSALGVRAHAAVLLSYLLPL
jgi:hypothetical protein